MTDFQTDIVPLIEEARTLRMEIGPGEIGDTPEVLHSTLLQARSAQDRVDEIVSMLLLLRSRAKSDLADRQAALEDAENDAYTSNLVGFDQYTTGRERAATIANKTAKEKIAVRLAERTDQQMATAVEVCKVFQRGLEGLRRDLDLRLRIVLFTARLES